MVVPGGQQQAFASSFVALSEKHTATDPLCRHQTLQIIPSEFVWGTALRSFSGGEVVKQPHDLPPSPIHTVINDLCLASARVRNLCTVAMVTIDEKPQKLP